MLTLDGFQLLAGVGVAGANALVNGALVLLITYLQPAVKLPRVGKYLLLQRPRGTDDAHVFVEQGLEFHVVFELFEHRFVRLRWGSEGGAHHFGLEAHLIERNARQLVGTCLFTGSVTTADIGMDARVDQFLIADIFVAHRRHREVGP